MKNSLKMTGNLYNLSGKKILVTGASSGIGREIANLAAGFGADLIITGRNTERLGQVLSGLQPGDHKVVVSDLTKTDNIDQLVSMAGKLDGVVHSAGITAYMPVQFINEKSIGELMKINFEAPVTLTARLLRKKKIIDGGAIVFLSSIATKYPYFGGAMYAASKSALEGYARVLALELAPRKIRVNCLSPAFVETEMLKGAKGTVNNEGIDQYESFLPLGFGKPEDVAKAAVYFLSDHSAWITGENLKMGAF
ncbi:MAG: SDR family oxidoreductase [Bacteroidota bacterium]